MSEPQKQTPSIGRIIHSKLGVRWVAAIVTSAPESNGAFHVTLFPPNSPPELGSATLQEEGTGWRWPPYVPPQSSGSRT